MKISTIGLGLVGIVGFVLIETKLTIHNRFTFLENIIKKKLIIKQ